MGTPALASVAALLVASVAGAVQARPAAQRSFGPGRCGPIDASYIRVSTATGGQPFPMAPAEIAKMGAVMAESSRSDVATILWAGGTATDAADGYVVPVDGAVRRVTFSITFDGTGGSAEVTTPEGVAISPGSGPGDTLLNCGRILSIDAPATGAWRVVPSPSSRFWLVVHARTDRDHRAEFVRFGGRPGHEGLFRINGSPIAGRPAVLRIELAQPDDRQPVFELFSVQGRPIRRASLDKAGDDEFVGEIELPGEPFRVGVTGTDGTGSRYQRMDRRLFHAEPVEVVPPPLQSIAAGADVPVEFIIRNHGARARYQVRATVGAEVLRRVEPAVVDLAADGEQQVTVWLPAATIAAAGTSLELLVVASGEDLVQSSMNNAILRLAIVRK